MARTGALARESELLSQFRAADLPHLAPSWHGTAPPAPARADGAAPAWIAPARARRRPVRRPPQTCTTARAGAHHHRRLPLVRRLGPRHDDQPARPDPCRAAGPRSARSVLRAFADVVDGGMIPNRFPDGGEAPEYNTVDATFWFVEAVAGALRAPPGTRPSSSEMFPVLAGIVGAMQAGARYGIRVDADGLIRAGEPGVQLTWMDAKVGDWVVTPRIGKPIEVNALWLEPLRFMAEAAPRRRRRPRAPTPRCAQRAAAGFERFWNPERGYAFDVIDGPGRAMTRACGRTRSSPPAPAPALRRRPPPRHRRCRLRARARSPRPACAASRPSDPAYRPHYGGDQTGRDGAYHQGTVWAWLIGPFIEAHLAVLRRPGRAPPRSWRPLADQLAIEGIGTIGEIFEADAAARPARLHRPGLERRRGDPRLAPDRGAAASAPSRPEPPPTKPVTDPQGDRTDGRHRRGQAPCPRRPAPTGCAGGPTSASASGARCARITAPAAPPGTSSRTITPAPAPTAGARTASPASPTTSSGSASRWPCGTATTRS